MTESFSTRAWSFVWFLRRGQSQRRGDIISVTKASGDQVRRDVVAADRYRVGARKGILFAALLSTTTNATVIGEIHPYADRCYQRKTPEVWYVDCSRNPDGTPKRTESDPSPEGQK